MASPEKKLRVLCLHGHRTNAKVMHNQTKGLRAALGEDATDFIFLDAPHEATGPTDPVVEHRHAQDAPFYEWWQPRVLEDIEEGETRWIARLNNYDATLAFMEAKLAEIGPVDVVIGFSQGAVLLTTLSMLYVQKYKRRLWKLCVCVGGVQVVSVDSRGLFETPDGRPILVPFPSIHVVGRKDPLYEESLMMVELFDPQPTMFPQSPLRRVVVYHDGGHKFPSVPKYESLYEDLARRITEHCRLADADGNDDRTCSLSVERHVGGMARL